MSIQFIIIMNRQGKVRLSRWYGTYADDEKQTLKSQVHKLVSSRDHKYQSNFVEFQNNNKLVYKRFAGLFIVFCVGLETNDLIYLESIQLLVEVLDAFFGNVCELDIVFNFYKVYAILDEMFLGGEIEETSKDVIIERIKHCERFD